MSGDIYLRKAVITGFRGLADEFSVEFADSPGITILLGPNGSGKSTVFDAVEWALTGGSARLPSLTNTKNAPDPFRTLFSDENPIVKLEFADGPETIVFSSEEGPERAAELLKNPSENWQRLTSVPRALQQTHFSSQRAAMRLAYEEDSGSLLEAFAAPGGLDRLRSLETRLWGNETRLAFKKLKDDAQKQTEDHRRTLVVLNRLIEVRAQEAGLDAAGIRQRLAEILSRLPPELPALDAADDIDAVERELFERKRRSDTTTASVRDLSDARRTARTESLLANANAEAARETAATADRLLQTREAAASVAAAEEAASAAEAERISTEVAAIEERIAMAVRRDQLRSSIESKASMLRELRARHSIAIHRAKDLSELEALSRRNRAGAQLQILKETEAALILPRNPTEVVATASLTIQSLDATQASLRASREAALVELTGEQERLETIRGFASALAEQLTEHDNTCPVCAATYEKGVLAKRAAEQSQKAISLGVADLARRLNELTQELGRVDGVMRVATSQLLDAQRKAAQLAENRAEQARQLKAFGDDWSPEAASEVSISFDELLARIAFEPGESLASAVASVCEEVEQADVAIARHEAERTEECAELDQLAARLPHGETVVGLSAVQLELQNAHSRAAARLRTTREAAAHTTALLSSELAAAQAARRDLEEKTRVSEDASRRAADVAEALERLVGVEDVASFLAAQRSLTAHYDQLLGSISTLKSEARSVASASEVFEQEMQLLRSRYGATPPDDEADLRTLIEAAIVKAQQNLSSITDLGSRLSVKAKDVRGRDRAVRSNELAPWNTLFNLVYKNLAGSSRESLEFTTKQVDMRTSGVEAHRNPRVDNLTLEGWMPVHFFSEGQIAALQISNVVTASVLYPWSRWRALMFDDPLQHADVIKVNAFSDLVRGLSADMGHQIVVTMYDEQQANFIAAKFAAAGLMARMHPMEHRISMLPSLKSD